MKLCCDCSTFKGLDGFYAHPTNADRLAGVCKECHKSRMKRRRLTDPYVQEYERARAKTPERKELSARISAQWRKAHPDAYRAQTAVNNAVRDKRLQKDPCSICGTEKDVHGHHKDYAKPLDVIWLCAKCHHRVHATFPELGGHFQAAE